MRSSSFTRSASPSRVSCSAFTMFASRSAIPLKASPISAISSLPPTSARADRSPARTISAVRTTSRRRRMIMMWPTMAAMPRATAPTRPSESRLRTRLRSASVKASSREMPTAK